MYVNVYRSTYRPFCMFTRDFVFGPSACAKPKKAKTWRTGGKKVDPPRIDSRGGQKKLTSPTFGLGGVKKLTPATFLGGVNLTSPTFVWGGSTFDPPHEI